MKRYLLFVMLCVCVSIGAWADATFNVSHSGGDVTVNFDPAGTYTVSTGASEVKDGFSGTLYITGTVGVDDVEALLAGVFGTQNQNNKWGTSIDMSAATIDDIDNLSGLDIPCVKRVILPSNTSSITSSMVSLFTSWGYDGSALMYIIIDSCPVQVYASQPTTSRSYDSTISPYVSSVFSDCSNAVVTGYNEAAIANAVSLLEAQGVTIPKSKSITCAASELGTEIQNCIENSISVTGITITSGTLSSADATALQSLINANLADDMKLLDLTASTGTDISTFTLPESLETVLLPTGTTAIPANVSALADKNLQMAFASATVGDKTTVTVLPAKQGAFKDFYQANASKFPAGATVKFHSSSKVNGADLAALAGDQKDGNNNYNKYYVDLYDMPLNTTMDGGTSTIEDAIEDAITIMRTNNWQYKGLLLPKNPTTVGTTLIQDSNKTAQSIATCSQFISYVNGTTTTAHIYKASDEYQSATYDERFAAFKAAIEQHSEIEANTTSYLISTNSTEKIDISTLRTAAPNATIIETINNEMVRNTATGNSSIYAYNAAPGGFGTVAANTSVQNTNAELLELNGPVQTSDFLAISDFTNGPRVLDLRNTTGLTAAMVAQIQNSHIEYILLPAGWEKANVNTAANITNLTGLKAAISISSDGKNLVGYLGRAGSLAEARCLWEGGTAALGTDVTVDGVTYKRFTPTTTGTLENLTLSGNLNASDMAANIVTGIAVNIKNGNLYSDASYNPGNIGEQLATGNGYQATTGVTAGSNALNGEGKISYIDLTDAVFANQNDMNFNMLGLVNGSLSTVKLPTSSSMTTLPFASLLGSSGNVIDYLCIPSNIKNINRYALANTTVRCITTDNANHTVVIGANGEQFATDAEAKAACYDTFTFSSSIEFIGTGAVTPQSETITDVYVMATTTPRCEINAFSSGMLRGWDGFDGAGAYCRAKYINGTKYWTMLHFPEQGNMTDEAYMEMKKKYTDVNKEYTKKDQTGAVDGNGNPIAWPSMNEALRTYTQASWGLTWNDWIVTKDPEVNTTGDGRYVAQRYPDVTAEATGNPSHKGDYDFADYIGWHQFVLSMATYFDQPDIIIENEKTVLEYVEGDWYTLCLPFSLTEDQLIEMLGVPKSDDNTISRLVDKDGTVIEESVPDNKLPDLRTLKSVYRTPGSPNEVTFRMTNNLSTVSENNAYSIWRINDSDPDYSNYQDIANIAGTKIALYGGYPYLVKPYKRKGETFKNLGQYIMTRFADQFENDKFSCKSLDYCSENLNGTSATAKFPKPFERHKIQAYLSANEKNTPTTHKDGTNYYYAFVGQFWQQDLPRYAFYLVNNRWYRYTSGNKGWKWEPYKCIIMASQETGNTSDRAHASSGLYRDDTKSIYPVSTGTDSKGAEIFDGKLYIAYLDGRDDAIFDNSNVNYAKFNFVLDDEIMEVNDDEVTAIMKLDGEDIQTMPKNGKVYNTAGQFVGTSMEGLAKGLYIVNGKKIVVK